MYLYVHLYISLFVYLYICICKCIFIQNRPGYHEALADLKAALGDAALDQVTLIYI